MKQTERLTFTQKNANNKKWYKDKADYFDTLNRSTFDRKSMQVNYDLFNNKVDIRDFEYICKPFGSDIGELPARMTNKDIVTGKIKAIMGMEMKRPFTYRVISTNPEATTQREKKEFEMIREYIVGQIMAPIQELSLIHISEPTRQAEISYAVFCLKKKKKKAHQRDTRL